MILLAEIVQTAHFAPCKLLAKYLYRMGLFLVKLDTLDWKCLWCYLPKSPFNLKYDIAFQINSALRIAIER